MARRKGPECVHVGQRAGLGLGQGRYGRQWGILPRSAPVPQHLVISLTAGVQLPCSDCGLCTSAHSRSTEASPPLSLNPQHSAPGSTHLDPLPRSLLGCCACETSSQLVSRNCLQCEYKSVSASSHTRVRPLLGVKGQ